MVGVGGSNPLAPTIDSREVSKEKEFRPLWFMLLICFWHPLAVGAAEIP